jgi:hypothetical protein
MYSTGIIPLQQYFLQPSTGISTPPQPKGITSASSSAMVSRSALLPFNFLTPLLHTLRPPVSCSTSFRISLQPIPVHARHLHSTPIACAALHRNAGGSGKGNRPTVDPRVRLIRYHLEHPKTPRPLRLSRMRSLRHWTIHRAWMLFKRKKRESEERELLRYE